jgi:hypothetical protein
MRNVLAALISWCAIAAAGCGGSGTLTGPSDPSAPQTVAWSIDFGTTLSDSLDVSACTGDIRGGFCSQIINVDSSGAFHAVWSPPTPNVLQADGTMTATTLSAVLKCVATSATGSLSASASGSDYTGTATLSGKTVPIRVTRGPAQC